MAIPGSSLVPRCSNREDKNRGIRIRRRIERKSRSRRRSRIRMENAGAGELGVIPDPNPSRTPHLNPVLFRRQSASCTSIDSDARLTSRLRLKAG